MKTLRFRLALFATFLLIFPFFLRRRPRVERRITILASPATIFAQLEDLRRWPLWNAWSAREERHCRYGEIARGAGAEQRWEGRRMSGTMRILKCEPDERIDYEVVLDGEATPLVGRIELHPDGACTRVVWKCAWDLAPNPYHRYFDVLLRWMIRRDFGTGLANLKALIESTRAPEKVAA